MNINRHNYEEYFLLYVDNELNIVQRKAVDAFIAENPDLKAELLILQESVLPADEHIVFSNKASLLRTTTAPNPVNETNCEEYFVLYADDELTNEQKDLVEQFVYRNPQHQANFELMQQVKLMPDTAVVFPDKYALYRKEEDDRVVPVVPMRWWKMAAAAAILLFVGGIGWYMSGTGKNGTTTPDGDKTFAVIDTAKNKPSATQPPSQQMAATNEQKDQQQVPDVAVNPDQQKKEATQQQPALKLPLKAVKAIDIADNTKKEKNNAPQRNIPAVPDVQPTEAFVNIKKPEETKEDKLKASAFTTEAQMTDVAKVKINLPVKSTEIPATSSKTVVDDFPNSGIDNTYASTDDKKNKMRGFFRKVSRVFEKTANVDADGKERTGIRIASFEFALK